MKWTIPTSEDWNAVAREIAAQLGDGDILALSGPLGAGKTTFVQALAQALGAEKTPKSPTFSLLRVYQISAKDLKRIVHVDAYRIENELDLIPLNLDEELTIPGTILLIEWPEQIPQWLSGHHYRLLEIAISEEGRTAELTEK